MKRSGPEVTVLDAGWLEPPPATIGRIRIYHQVISVLFPGETAQIILDPRNGGQVFAVVHPMPGWWGWWLRTRYRLRRVFGMAEQNVVRGMRANAEGLQHGGGRTKH